MEEGVKCKLCFRLHGTLDLLGCGCDMQLSQLRSHLHWPPQSPSPSNDRSLWNGYDDALRRQRELLNTMEVASYITIRDLDSIRALVDQFKIQINLMAQNIEFAVRGDEAMMFGIEEIKKKLALFMKSIEYFGEQVDRCSRVIQRTTVVVLQRIIKDPK